VGSLDRHLCFGDVAHDLVNLVADQPHLVFCSLQQGASNLKDLLLQTDEKDGNEDQNGSFVRYGTQQMEFKWLSFLNEVNTG
jgi:hypothetical protein